MKTKKNILKILGAFLLIFTLTFSTNSYAAISGGDNDSSSQDSSSQDSSSQDSGSEDSGSRDSVPLDGGLSILVLGAAAFGIKKLKNRK